MLQFPMKLSEDDEVIVAACYANANKAMSLFGWKTELSIEYMVKDTWKWQKSTPEGYPES